MNPTLEGYCAAIFDGLGDDASSARPLAAELAAIDRLIHDNAPLRLAITDTAVPPAQRRAILSELLEGKVSSAARRLVAFAAGAVSASDVPGAINWLTLQVQLVAQGGDRETAALSFSAARRRVGGFAAALFEDMDTGQLEEMEDELFRFARTVESTPALRGALTNSDLPVEVRRGVVGDLLGDKVQPATLRVVRYVVVGGRPRDLVGTLDWLVEETARARGWRVARLRAAAEVQDDQQDRLSESLASITGAPVELQVTVDPTLLGGVVIQVGDLLLDASASGRLDRLREQLLPGGWEDAGFGQQGRRTHSEGAR